MAVPLKARTWQLFAQLAGSSTERLENVLPSIYLKICKCTEGRAWESARFEGLLSCLFPQS